MLKRFSFIMLLLSTFTLIAENITIVRNGNPSSVIVLAEKPTRAAQMAALEIQHAVKKMSGATLPVVYGSVPANTLPIRIISDNSCPVGETFFTITSDGVTIKGRDDVDFKKVDYKKFSTFPAINYVLKGTLDSAYDFLESACGVRYYSLNDDECIYPVQKNIVLKKQTAKHRPSMKNERLFTSNPPKNREMALLQLRWRQTLLTGGVNHNTWSIYFRYYGKAKGRFYGNVENLFIEKRPEYFANHKGQSSLSHISHLYPGDKDLPPQICLSHEGPVKYFAHEAVSAYKGIDLGAGIRFKPKRIDGVPYSYPILEDDNKCFCECDNCKKTFAKLPLAQLHGYLHFDWLNRIAQNAKKQQPDIWIASCAYSKSLDYPDPKILKLADNLAIKICLAIDSWQHPGLYKWQHGIYKKWVKNEAQRRPISIWGYMLSPSFEAKIFYKYGDFFPMLRPWKIGDIFKEFTADGVSGYYVEIDLDTQILEGYVLNKIALNGPDTDVNALLDEYFTLTYGKAASAVKDFYLTIQDIVSNPKNYPAEIISNFRKTSFAGGIIHTVEANHGLITAKNLKTLDNIIKKAYSLAATPQEKSNVAKLDKKYYQMILSAAKTARQRKLMQDTPLSSLRAAKLSQNMNGNISALKAEMFNVSNNPWYTIEGIPQKDPSLRIGSAFDDEYFYLYFQDLKYNAPPKRDSGIWRDNIEIFLSSSMEEPFGHLAISPSGESAAVRHDYPGGVPKISNWPLTSKKVKCSVKNGVWTAVMAIKLNELLPDKAMHNGRRFFINVMRTRRTDGRVSSAWSLLLNAEYVANSDRMGKIYLR